MNRLHRPLLPQSAPEVMGKTAQTAQPDCNPEHNPIGWSCVNDHRTVLSSPESQDSRLPVQQHPRRGMGPEAGTSGKQSSQAFSCQHSQLRKCVSAMICLKRLWSRMRAMQVSLEAV